MTFIERPDPLARIEQRFQANPVVLLLGPRQCGKTTLARRFAAGRQAEYFVDSADRTSSECMGVWTAASSNRSPRRIVQSISVFRMSFNSSIKCNPSSGEGWKPNFS